MIDATRPRGRPTMYRGIPMRSRLEADFAATLDQGGWTWTYEPHCFADQTGQYLPDFRIDDADGHLYAEVKPPSIADDDLAAALSRMEIIWSSEPDARLALYLWRSPRFYIATRTAPWQLISPGNMTGRSEDDGGP